VWIAPKKREAGVTGIRRHLAELYPHLQDDELDLLTKITTKKDLDDYLKLAGQNAKK
jgi:hypothetical protein